MKTKETIKVIRKDGINFILDDKGRIKKFKPWLGDLFAFAYDSIIQKSIFPKKFKGSIAKHFELLKKEYQTIQNKNVLEIATGSGFSSELLNTNISYTGIDISAGLIKQAARKFEAHHFTDAEFFVSAANELPFSDQFFDIVICDLSLNFLGDLEDFIKEIKRVMKTGSVFYCSVPVPEKKDPKVIIHGNLYSENELKTNFEKHNFIFNLRPNENGALLYFNTKLV
ncbi:MAG: class I SAM-dependent methyltransferase [Bacteroidales bacterium]|nr:class I SAM-dependent methyltransferase [Bacteroidales bacterium]